MNLKLKKITILVMGLLLLFSISLAKGKEEEEPIEFHNQDLELAIREKIGKAVGDVYPSDLLEIKILKVSYSEIQDISVLKNCKNLETLRLRYNNISDLSPLSKLENLQYLSLGSNNISDLSPLAEIYSLDSVYLEGNEISSIKPLIENYKEAKNGDNAGLTKGNKVVISFNNLDVSENSEDLQDIQTLLDRGVEVEFYPQED